MTSLSTAAAAAAATLLRLANLLGLLRGKPAGTTAVGAVKDDGLTDKLMGLLIHLRQDARKNKNFAIADNIRDGLTKIGVTLEDRADGTVWRRTQ